MQSHLVCRTLCVKVAKQSFFLTNTFRWQHFNGTEHLLYRLTGSKAQPV
jgi:hypothetical protein